MKKLLLVAVVLVVLSIGIVTIAGAASAPVTGGAQAGVQMSDSGTASAVIDVGATDSMSNVYSDHGLCDHGDSADSAASY